MYNSFLTMHDYYAIPFLSSRLLFFDIGVHLLSDGKRRDGSFRPHSIISLSSHLVIRPPQPQHIAKSLYLVIIQVGGRKMPENPVNYEETPTQYTRTRAHLDPGASPVRRDGSVGFFFLSPSPLAAAGRGHWGISMKYKNGYTMVNMVDPERRKRMVVVGFARR